MSASRTNDANVAGEQISGRRRASKAGSSVTKKSVVTTKQAVGRKAGATATPRPRTTAGVSADRQASEMLHEIRTRGEELTARVNALLTRLG